MSNFIENIRIDNFKSIFHCKLDDCKRINLLIGGPNSGKSNLLEALSLFSLPFVRENASKKVTSFIRLKYPAQLFYNGNVNLPVTVTTNRETCEVQYQRDGKMLLALKSKDGKGTYTINSKLNVRSGENSKYSPSVRRYSFLPGVTFRQRHQHYLMPPYGDNLWNVLNMDSALKQNVLDLLEEYNLDAIFDDEFREPKLMQANKEGANILEIPYASIAKSLQRIVFYKTAIASNHDAVLLLEEPETDIFLPCLSEILQEIINKKDLQFFISTHSPYVLNEFLEDARGELTVHLLNYKDRQTKVKRLSDAELHQAYQDGVDLFFNSESYL